MWQRCSQYENQINFPSLLRGITLPNYWYHSRYIARSVRHPALQLQNSAYYMSAKHSSELFTTLIINSQLTHRCVKMESRCKLIRLFESETIWMLAYLLIATQGCWLDSWNSRPRHRLGEPTRIPDTFHQCRINKHLRRSRTWQATGDPYRSISNGPSVQNIWYMRWMEVRSNCYI